MARTLWETAEIKTLLEIWAENSIMDIFDGKSRNTKAYAEISARLEVKGIVKTAAQVQTKMKTLRQTYNRAKDAVSRSGASREAADKICPYFDTMDQFLGCKPVSNPHFLQTSSGICPTVVSVVICLQ